MRSRSAHRAALLIAVAATGLGLGAAVVSGSPAATAQGYIPCEQWQAMHPGWPCIDTPQPPQTGPPTVSTPPPLPSQTPGIPGQPGNGGGIGAGALTPPPIAPGNGTPIVPVPGAEPPVLPGNERPAPQQQVPAGPSVEPTNPGAVPPTVDAGGSPAPQPPPTQATTPATPATTDHPAPVSPTPPAMREPSGPGSDPRIPFLLILATVAFGVGAWSVTRQPGGALRPVVGVLPPPPDPDGPSKPLSPRPEQPQQTPSTPPPAPDPEPELRPAQPPTFTEPPGGGTGPGVGGSGPGAGTGGGGGAGTGGGDEGEEGSGSDTEMANAGVLLLPFLGPAVVAALIEALVAVLIALLLALIAALLFALFQLFKTLIDEGVKGTLEKLGPMMQTLLGALKGFEDLPAQTQQQFLQRFNDMYLRLPPGDQDSLREQLRQQSESADPAIRDLAKKLEEMLPPTPGRPGGPTGPNPQRPPWPPIPPWNPEKPDTPEIPGLPEPEIPWTPPSTDPVPGDPQPGEPEPIEPIPTEPQPTEPRPTEPAPVLPEPAPGPIEPEPTDPATPEEVPLPPPPPDPWQDPWATPETPPVEVPGPEAPPVPDPAPEQPPWGAPLPWLPPQMEQFEPGGPSDGDGPSAPLTEDELLELLRELLGLAEPPQSPSEHLGYNPSGEGGLLTRAGELDLNRVFEAFITGLVPGWAFNVPADNPAGHLKLDNYLELLNVFLDAKGNFDQLLFKPDGTLKNYFDKDGNLRDFGFQATNIINSMAQKLVEQGAAVQQLGSDAQVVWVFLQERSAAVVAEALNDLDHSVNVAIYTLEEWLSELNELGGSPPPISWEDLLRILTNPPPTQEGRP